MLGKPPEVILEFKISFRACDVAGFKYCLRSIVNRIFSCQRKKRKFGPFENYPLYGNSMGQTLIIIEVSFIIMEVLYGGFTVYRSSLVPRLAMRGNVWLQIQIFGGRIGIPIRLASWINHVTSHALTMVTHFRQKTK